MGLLSKQLIYYILETFWNNILLFLVLLLTKILTNEFDNKWIIYLFGFLGFRYVKFILNLALMYLCYFSFSKINKQVISLKIANFCALSCFWKSTQTKRILDFRQYGRLHFWGTFVLCRHSLSSSTILKNTSLYRD